VTSSLDTLLARTTRALDLPPPAALAGSGDGALPSAYAVTDLAAASLGGAALALRELVRVAFDDTPALHLDRRLASLWFGRSLQPVGWELPPAWDAIAGDYATCDGWIRLHTNAPRHRAAALAALGCAGERAAVAAAVREWRAEALESAVIEHVGCAAAMRSAAEWQAHPQGAAVAAEPLVALSTAPATFASTWRPARTRPLAGLKVLDLTRILAGPIATRYLAGYGADVLRIDPPGWDEPAVAPEVTLGKACARLDLEQAADRARFERLLARADVLVHGYRPGALEALGYAGPARRAINPGLVDVSLNAYGWSGPWQHRRGFDSLVQMSAGFAQRGMAWKGADRPTPLPVQALDHATGYLIAAAAIRGLVHRLAEGRATTARLSLARTARLLEDFPTDRDAAPIVATDADFAAALEPTAWGPARRLGNAAALAGIEQAWRLPARPLGWATPEWPGD
jgi:crotonobetainyl-CoA:carnitine CoA-transferase CaiB-like acyl-CoA transferase